MIIVLKWFKSSSFLNKDKGICNSNTSNKCTTRTIRYKFTAHRMGLIVFSCYSLPQHFCKN